MPPAPLASRSSSVYSTSSRRQLDIVHIVHPLSIHVFLLLHKIRKGHFRETHLGQFNCVVPPTTFMRESLRGVTWVAGNGMSHVDEQRHGLQLKRRLATVIPRLNCYPQPPPLVLLATCLCYKGDMWYRIQVPFDYTSFSTYGDSRQFATQVHFLVLCTE